MNKFICFDPVRLVIGLLVCLVSTQSQALSYQIQRFTVRSLLVTPEDFIEFRQFNNSTTAVGHDFNNAKFETRASRWGENDAAPIKLGTLGTDNNGIGESYAEDINNGGIAVGGSILFVNNKFQGFRAVRWAAGATMPASLGTLGTDNDGIGSSYAMAINDKGVAVGQSTLYANGNSQGPRAVRWAAGATTPANLGTLGTDNNDQGWSSAEAINDNGVAVGGSEFYLNGNYQGFRAVRWAAGATTPTNLGTLNAESNSSAQAINKNGVAVGHSTLYVNGNYQGFRAVRWAAGSTTPANLGTLGTDSFGYGYSYAQTINDNNIAVGGSELYINGNFHGSRAVRWASGANTPTNLGTLGEDSNGTGYSHAYDINNGDTAVGHSELYINGISQGYHAVLWGKDGKIQDLNSLLSPDDVVDGWVLNNAVKINNNGQILATAINQEEIYLYYVVLSLVDEDPDGDAVPNSKDNCPLTPKGEIVDPLNGCSIAQLVPCNGPMGSAQKWPNHLKYVSEVSKATENFQRRGLITRAQKHAIVSEAAHSTCGVNNKRLTRRRNSDLF